jgi:hypothetical protein
VSAAGVLVASRVVSLAEVGKLRAMFGQYATSPAVSLDDVVEGGKVRVLLYDHGATEDGQRRVRIDYQRPSEVRA